MRERPAGRAGERGASLVEFAFVIPIVLALLMGLVTYGLVEAGDNTASSAAREGARVGILRYEHADRASTSRSAIVAAVNRHMDSGFVSRPSVSIRCVKPRANGSVPVPSSADSCAPEDVEPGRDLIEVRVGWDPIGPVSSSRRSELARMTIIGRPQLSEGSVPPPIDDDPDDDLPPEEEDPGEEEPEPQPAPGADCVIEKVTLSPNPVPVKTNKKELHKAVVYRAETNGAENCGAVVFHWSANTHGEATTAPDPVPGDDAYIGSLPAGSGNWTTGAKAVTAVAENGASFTLSFRAEPHNW